MSSTVVAAPVQVRAPIFNIIERLLWTAVQAFLGALPATLAIGSDDLSAVGYAALAAAIAAVISAAKNATSEMLVRQSAARAALGTAAEVR